MRTTPRTALGIIGAGPAGLAPGRRPSRRPVSTGPILKKGERTHG
ncbi:hypothetical protein ACFXAZ_10780 [Streptomyces sp. NPDC059477]